MNKLISTISLSKRAGKLVLGYDAVREGLACGEFSIVFITKDLSPKTEKNIRFLCNQEEAEVVKIPAVMDQIWAEVGKKAGILAINDVGLARKLANIVAVSKEELDAK